MRLEYLKLFLLLVRIKSIHELSVDLKQMLSLTRLARCH